MSARHAAKGPLGVILQTPAGQYAMLGIGIYVFFPEQFDILISRLRGDSLRLGDGRSNSANNSMTPIIIQTPAPTIIGGHGGNSSSGTVVAIITKAAIGAGVCWAGYVVCAHILPEQVAQYFPVTRAIFDKTTQALGRGILSVKKVLEEKMLGLSDQMDDLGKKQDGTSKTVSHIKSELGEARIDLSMLTSSLERCENSLEKNGDMQDYTLRGVKLLARCVGSFIPDESTLMTDLKNYVEDGNSINRSNGTTSDRLRSAVAVPISATPEVNRQAPRVVKAPQVTPTLKPWMVSLAEEETQNRRATLETITFQDQEQTQNRRATLERTTLEDHSRINDIGSLLGH
jgi:hypothetical protein